MGNTKESIIRQVEKVSALWEEQRKMEAKADAIMADAEPLRKFAEKAGTKAARAHDLLETTVAVALVDFGICPDLHTAVVSIRNTPGCLYRAFGESGDPFASLKKMFIRRKARIRESLDRSAHSVFDVTFILPEQKGTLHLVAATQEEAEKAFNNMTVYEVVAECDSLEEQAYLVERSEAAAV